MAEFITKRFVHLTFAQAGTAVFANTETEDATTHYYDITGSTATDAELVEHQGTPYGTAVAIPPSSVVFIDFPDGTTAIVSHLKFYSKLDEINGGTTQNPSIRVLSDEELENAGLDGNGFPSSTSIDLGIAFGDVCAIREVYSGDQISGFAIAVCNSASSYEDSGNTTYQYEWTVVYSWPNSIGWADASAATSA